MLKEGGGKREAEAYGVASQQPNVSSMFSAWRESSCDSSVNAGRVSTGTLALSSAQLLFRGRVANANRGLAGEEIVE